MDMNTKKQIASGIVLVFTAVFLCVCWMC